MLLEVRTRPLLPPAPTISEGSFRERAERCPRTPRTLISSRCWDQRHPRSGLARTLGSGASSDSTSSPKRRSSPRASFHQAVSVPARSPETRYWTLRRCKPERAASSSQVRPASCRACCTARRSAERFGSLRSGTVRRCRGNCQSAVNKCSLSCRTWQDGLRPMRGPHRCGDTALKRPHLEWCMPQAGGRAVVPCWPPLPGSAALGMSDDALTSPMSLTRTS